MTSLQPAAVVAVGHEGDQGPVQLGALALEHGEPRAAELGRAVQIQDAQGRVPSSTWSWGVAIGRECPSA